MRPIWAVKKGRMSAEEKAAIDRLAATMRAPTPGKIAQKLERHPSTVAWYMIRAGLIEREITYSDNKVRRRRDGTVVIQFDRAEDRRLVELRRDGKPYREIADVLNVEFGNDRDAHSAQVRHAMLAAYDGGEDALLAEIAGGASPATLPRGSAA